MNKSHFSLIIKRRERAKEQKRKRDGTKRKKDGEKKRRKIVWGVNFNNNYLF